ncbi:MAG: hypothetical protein ABFS12_13805 [Bacteroidota bacterium]
MHFFKSLVFGIIFFGFYSCNNTIDIEKEKKDIIAVIENETNSFFVKNFEKQSESFLQDERLTVLISRKKFYGYVVGWDELSKNIKINYENNTHPGTETFTNTNYKINVYENSAWAIYDENVYNSEGVYIRRVINVRFLEKVDGKWKIVYLSDVDTSSYEIEEERKYSHKLDIDINYRDQLSKWSTNDNSKWAVSDEKDNGTLELRSKGVFDTIRKPSSFAVVKDLDVGNFKLTLEAKSFADISLKGRDVVIYFGYRDPTHFYYVHVSNENTKYHNIIGLVNGGDRKPLTSVIADEDKARLNDCNWHKIKVERDASSGMITVFVDDMINPIHAIYDKTLLNGSIGVGSFDDTGAFRNIELLYD